jgi:hypothetical protein
MGKKVVFDVTLDDVVDMFVDDHLNNDFKYYEYEWLFEVYPDWGMYTGDCWVGWIVNKYNIRKFTDFVEFLKNMVVENPNTCDSGDLGYYTDEHIIKLIEMDI